MEIKRRVRVLQILTFYCAGGFGMEWCDWHWPSGGPEGRAVDLSFRHLPGRRGLGLPGRRHRLRHPGRAAQQVSPSLYSPDFPMRHYTITHARNAPDPVA